MPDELKPYKELAVEILEEFTNCFSEADEDVLARMIRDSSFRKASDVAREIFEEIEKLIGEAIEIEDKRGRNAWGDGDTSAFMTHQYTEEKLECLQTALAELKKKYEKEG